MRWMRRARVWLSYDRDSDKKQITSNDIKAMEYNYDKKLVPLAQKLRKNMTPEEKHLWYDFLKKLPKTVHRQKNIGRFIVDFYIADPPTVIEVDGAQHGAAEQEKNDRKRDCELGRLNIQVLRYTNRDINKNFYSVCEDILEKLGISASEMKER